MSLLFPKLTKMKKNNKISVSEREDRAIANEMCRIINPLVIAHMKMLHKSMFQEHLSFDLSASFLGIDPKWDGALGQELDYSKVGIYWKII